MSKIFSGQNKWNNIKYKYRFKFPRGFKGAIRFYHDNGNTLWQDAIGKEISQIKEIQTFRPLKRGPRAPNDHTFVLVNMLFGVKFILSRKAQLVAGGNITWDSEEDINCGVVSIETFRKDFFLRKLNDLEVDTKVHELTKYKISIVTGSEFGEW